MELLHGVVFIFVLLLGLWSVISIIRIVLCFFKKIISCPRAILRTIKRSFLFPTHFLRTAFCGPRSGSVLPSWILSIAFFALAILCVLEGYRYTGADIRIGSYLEYPYATSCYRVQFQRTSAADTSKFYSLPTEIKRAQGDDDSFAHYPVKAYWPNGGWLTFSSYSEPLEVGKAVIVYDQEDVEWQAVLTSQPASHPQIQVTTPRLNAISVFCSIAALLFLLGIFPFQYPNYEYANDNTAEELPPTAPYQSDCQELIHRFAAASSMSDFQYLECLIQNYETRAGVPYTAPKTAECLVAAYAQLGGMTVKEYIALSWEGFKLKNKNI